MDNGARSYRRFLDGDDNGIIEIIRDYNDGLILFLNRYVDNIHTAEDLAEDTFVRLVTKKPHYSPKYSFKTWLFTIGRNLALNHLRRNRRVIDVSEEELTAFHSDEESLEQSYLREERKILLHRALSGLRPDYAQVMYLKFFEEQNNEEISRIMKKTRRQVENLVYQAKRSLKSQLEQEGYSYEELQ